jgi:hypothetical protein
MVPGPTKDRPSASCLPGQLTAERRDLFRRKSSLTPGLGHACVAGGLGWGLGAVRYNRGTNPVLAATCQRQLEKS